MRQVIDYTILYSGSGDYSSQDPVEKAAGLTAPKQGNQ